MANDLFQSFLNPWKFTPKNPVNIPQYVSKFMDDVLYAETIRYYQEQNALYFQPQLTSDAARNVYISNYGPLTVWLMDSEGRKLPGQVLTNGAEDASNPGYFYRYMDLDLSAYDPGIYLPILEAGSAPDVWFGEPIRIKENCEDTLLLEYSNYKMKGNIIFFKDDGVQVFSPSLRIPAILKYIGPKSIDTLYFDRRHNAKFLEAVDFDAYKLVGGNSDGWPPWLAKKVGKIITCSDWKIDGRQFAKSAEDAVLEQNEFDTDYPMSAYTIELVEALNRSGIQYTNNNPNIPSNSMMAVMETKGFGINDIGGDFLEIIVTE